MASCGASNGRSVQPSRSAAADPEPPYAALAFRGELIAAIATVATLGYLAIQILQNTRSLRASSRLAATQTYNEHSRLRLDPVVNRAYVQGLGAFLSCRSMSAASSQI